MDLYNAIIATIWLTMLYAVWAATAAGDPGYGQAAFIISGIAGHLYLRKLKLERPVSNEEEIEIPSAEFSVEILEEKDKYVISEKAFRKMNGRMFDGNKIKARYVESDEFERAKKGEWIPVVS